MKLALVFASLLISMSTLATPTNPELCADKVVELPLFKAFPQTIKLEQIKGTQDYYASVSYLYNWSDICNAVYLCEKKDTQYSLSYVETTCTRK